MFGSELTAERKHSGRLSGKVALVTGASGGIGRAVSLALASEGAGVIVTGRRDSELIALAKECQHLGGTVRHLTGDLNEDHFIADLVRQAGEVDILINNAGILTYAPFLELSSAQCEAMFHTNVLATINLSQSIGKQMSARGSGHIVMMTSLSARTINRYGVIYGATKHALSGLAKGLRIELKDRGIKVTEIAPGMVETEIRNSIAHPEVVASLKARKFKALTPQDVAAAVIYALTCSENCCPDLIELRPLIA